MTGREDLEAFIWRAMRAYRVDVIAPVQFVDAVLRGADKYADTRLGTATENGITAARRAILAEAAPTVHFGHGDRHACRMRQASTGRAPARTLDPAAVTCARCKHTRAYAEAQGVAS